MPITSDYNPNYAQLVSRLTSAPSNVGSKDPKQQQQNAEQQGRALERISQLQQTNAPGSTGKPLPTGTSSSSLAPDSPNAGLSSADYAGAVDSSLGAAGGDALGGAAGDALGAGLTGAAGGAAADAAAGGGITDLLGLLL
jgi:hypothetical protein